MPKKKGKRRSSVATAGTTATQEMDEISDTEQDVKDSGHGSDAGSDVSGSDFDDDESYISSINDAKEMLKRRARERLHKCVVFLSEFWKIIMLLVQAGVVGGLGLLAYYMEFKDIFPKKETLFDCVDPSINKTYETSVFRDFIFGEYIAEDWVFLFSWFAPPGIMIVTEFLYSFHTGCKFSHHLKMPLLLRRNFRFIGSYYFGMASVLITVKSIKIFLTTPRPYFLSICQPNSTTCVGASHLICTQTNTTLLDDARTSFPSLPMGALSYSCIFVGVYLHQMIRNCKLYILQTTSLQLFLMISFLGACIEVGSMRSHWYDVAASYFLGCFLSSYQCLTLNYFVEIFQPPLPKRYEMTWAQTDPLPEPEPDDDYPYEEIMMGQLPKRRPRPAEEQPCVHRPNSFDSSFQSDMARSMRFFKKLNSLWTSNSAPSFNPDKAFYEQSLVIEKTEPEIFASEEKPLPSQPIEVQVVNEVREPEQQAGSSDALAIKPETPGLSRRPSTIMEDEEIHEEVDETKKTAAWLMSNADSSADELEPEPQLTEDDKSEQVIVSVIETTEEEDTNSVKQVETDEASTTKTS